MSAKLAQRYLEQATEDLRWASYLKDVGAYNISCFLSQQVAGKAIRALLFQQGERTPLTPSVVELCERAIALVPDIADKCAQWNVLDSFYVPTRYPNALPGSIPARVYDQRAAQDAVATATEVVETVRGKMAG